MSEQGYMDHDPLMRLIHLKWDLRATANAILDQAVHVDGMTRAAAMRMLMHDTFRRNGSRRQVGAGPGDGDPAGDLLRGLSGTPGAARGGAAAMGRRVHSEALPRYRAGIWLTARALCA